MGTAYLVKDKNNKEYAMKIQKINQKDIKKNLLSKVWREIEFAKFTKKYAAHFLQLVDYKFIDKCTHDQKLPTYFNFPSDKIGLKNKHDYEKLQQSSYCVQFVYDLLDGTLASIFNKLNKRQFISMLIQLVWIIYLLQENSYKHNDLHFANVMYKKVPMNEYITILNYKIPTYGYIYSVIDYGEVLSPKFGFANRNEKYMFNMYSSDLDFVMMALYQMPVWYYINKKKIIITSYNETIKLIKKEPIFDSLIKPYLTNKYYGTDSNIMLNLSILFNECRHYEIMGLPSNFEKYIIKQKLTMTDYLYMWKNIVEPKKILVYFIEKLAKKSCL